MLVIGLGWLNHSGQAGDNSTPFARDVSQALDRAGEIGEIPGSEPATPSPLESAAGGSASGRTTSTTIVVDPETGLRITVNLQTTPGTTGSSSSTGRDGGTGTTATTGGPGGTTGTTGGSGTTTPPSSAPPSSAPPSSSPPSSAPPSSAPPSSSPPSSSPSSTETPTTGPDPVVGLLDGLVGLLGL